MDVGKKRQMHLVWRCENIEKRHKEVKEFCVKPNLVKLGENQQNELPV